MRVSDAVPVQVSSGEIAEDTDVAVQMRRPITVTGHLVGPSALVSHATVRLCPTDDASRAAGLCATSTQAGPEGRFTLAAVIPGSYLLEAVTPGGAADPGPVAWGRRAAAFGSTDVEDADVPMAPTIALSGHVQTLLDASRCRPRSTVSMATSSIRCSSRPPTSPIRRSRRRSTGTDVLPSTGFGPASICSSTAAARPDWFAGHS